MYRVNGVLRLIKNQALAPLNFIWLVTEKKKIDCFNWIQYLPVDLF